MEQICKTCVYYDPESKVSGTCGITDTPVLEDESCGEWNPVTKAK
jgi:hypothetical protein